MYSSSSFLCFFLSPFFKSAVGHYNKILLGLGMRIYIAFTLSPSRHPFTIATWSHLKNQLHAPRFLPQALIWACGQWSRPLPVWTIADLTAHFTLCSLTLNVLIFCKHTFKTAYRSLHQDCKLGYESGGLGWSKALLQYSLSVFPWKTFN